LLLLGIWFFQLTGEKVWKRILPCAAKCET
jgi:hypothetical protein